MLADVLSGHSLPRAKYTEGQIAIEEARNLWGLRGPRQSKSIFCCFSIFKAITSAERVFRWAQDVCLDVGSNQAVQARSQKYPPTALEHDRAS